MVRRITLFPAQLNNFRVLDPDGGGDKNVVETKPEEKSAEPVEGHHLSTVGILQPESVQQRDGV